MSWYRTHRPQTIASLHLPEVRQALDRIRTSGAFSHAYLFTGPKGTGKTSSARILAKMLNCEKNAELVKKALSKIVAKDPKPFHEPCGVCSACISITNGSLVWWRWMPPAIVVLMTFVCFVSVST